MYVALLAEAPKELALMSRAMIRNAINMVTTAVVEHNRMRRRPDEACLSVASTGSEGAALCAISTKTPTSTGETMSSSMGVNGDSNPTVASTRQTLRARYLPERCRASLLQRCQLDGSTERGPKVLLFMPFPAGYRIETDCHPCL